MHQERRMRSSGPSLEAWSVVDIAPLDVANRQLQTVAYRQLGEDLAFGMYRWTLLPDPDEKLRQLVKCSTLEACAMLLDDRSSCTIITQTACQHWGLSAKYTHRAYEAKPQTGLAPASRLQVPLQSVVRSNWTLQRVTSSPVREQRRHSAL